jgi:hypothetical protein
MYQIWKRLRVERYFVKLKSESQFRIHLKIIKSYNHWNKDDPFTLYFKLNTDPEGKNKAYLGLLWYRGKPVIEASNDGYMPKQVSRICSLCQKYQTPQPQLLKGQELEMVFSYPSVLSRMRK